MLLLSNVYNIVKRLRYVMILTLFSLGLVISQEVEEDVFKNIDKAVEKAVKWLKDKQIKKGDDIGSWETAENDSYLGGKVKNNEIGLTALVLLALLKSDVEPDSQTIKDGFKFIIKNYVIKYHSNYERAVVLMALDAKYEAIQKFACKKRKIKWDPNKRQAYSLSSDDKNLAKNMADNIIMSQHKEGGWRYGLNYINLRGEQDISATQFMLLGLNAGGRLGIKIKPEVFDKALQYVLSQQEKDGEEVKEDVKKDKDDKKKNWTTEKGDKIRGWAYMKDSTDKEEATVSGSMTVAGICSLVICKTELEKTKYWNKKTSEKVEQAITDGLAWLQKNYTVKENPGLRNRHYYYLYGLERVGMLGDLEFIGGHDWYMDGAEFLLTKQKEDGYWDTKQEIQPSNTIDACYALLFLRKGTTPIGAIFTRSSGEKK